VFRPDQHRYRYYGHRKTLRFGFAPGDEKFTVEALEFEPLSRPDRAHVYLLLPVHPADHTVVAIGLPQVIATLAREFRLLWHLRDWPDHVPGCGIVVTPAGPESGWWRGWPWTSPGIEIPVKWLRGEDTYSVRMRSERHEAPVEDVAACLETTLPVWPAGTNEASVVATWQPGDRPAICPIPVDRTDYWLACRYAAQEAARLPGRGFGDLVLGTHRLMEWEAAERNSVIDVAEAGPWKPAALVRPPEQPVVHDDLDVSLIDAAHLLLGSASTPLGVGRAVVRLFADPMRGSPVVVPVQELPEGCHGFIRESPASDQASPRARHLLEAAADRAGRDGWHLREDRRKGVLYLYAVNETHVAWLPVGDRLRPDHSRELLPDEPDAVHLVKDSAGLLGGWVRGIDEIFTPLPNINGRAGTVPALAAVVTGRAPKLGAAGDRLARLLRQIPDGGHLAVPWHQLRSYAEELELDEPDQTARMPFCSGDEVMPEDSANGQRDATGQAVNDSAANHHGGNREHLDVLIVTALPEEFDAASAAGLASDPADPGIVQWEQRVLDGSMPFLWGEYRVDRRPRFTVALARPTQMGGRATGSFAATIAAQLNPAALAMCGVCAGSPANTALGDVVVAELVYEWDAGKQSSSGFEGDHRPFQLDPSWLRFAQDLDPAELASYGEASEDEALLWFLEQLHRGQQPRNHPARDSYFPPGTWSPRLARLEERGLIRRERAGVAALTSEGSELVQRRLYDDVDGPQRLPFRVLAAPMASGSSVAADAIVWEQLKTMGQRKISAVEMEAATIATVAHDRRVPWLIAKGVMDHADARKDDRYKRFAARASAQVMFALLDVRYRRAT